MIPYVEIIEKYTLKPFAIVEPSQCWFELSYYEIGEFEIYALATQNNLNALINGNYVKIPNKPYLWVIKSFRYTFTANGSRMISAKGYEAKFLISQRIILEPINLHSSLGASISMLFSQNIGVNATNERKINNFKTRYSNAIFETSIPNVQANRENLWTFMSNLLRTYHCGSYSTFEDGYIYHNAILGNDKTNEVIFSQSLDNLISSDYYEDSADRRTFCRVVSTFSEKNENDENISVDYTQDCNLGGNNIDRYEMVIQSNLSTKYTDPQGQEQETTPTSELYKSWQQQEGRNTLSEHIIKRDFSGEIDLNYSQYEFGSDFFLGDLVKVRDEHFGYEANARIIKYTFKQDAKGYGEEADYQSE